MPWNPLSTFLPRSSAVNTRRGICGLCPSATIPSKCADSNEVGNWNIFLTFPGIVMTGLIATLPIPETAPSTHSINHKVATPTGPGHRSRPTKKINYEYLASHMTTRFLFSRFPDSCCRQNGFLGGREWTETVESHFPSSLDHRVSSSSSTPRLFHLHFSD